MPPSVSSNSVPLRRACGRMRCSSPCLARRRPPRSTSPTEWRRHLRAAPAAAREGDAGRTARLIAPASAPTRIKRVIAAANRIVEKPYIYGGGHKPVSAQPARQRLRLLRHRCPTRSTAAASCAPRCPSRRADELGPARPGHAGSPSTRTAATPTSSSPGYRFDTSMHDRDAPGPRDRPALEQDAPQVERVRGAPPARLLSQRGPFAQYLLDSRSTTRSCPEQWR